MRLLDYLTESNYLRIIRIDNVVKENISVKTFFFKDELCATSKPGQFVMTWLPGFDEIPMSVSSTHNNGLVSLTVARVGEATSRLHKKKKGDIFGIRGPFGNSFTQVKGHALLVGGGTGIAPLAFLSDKLNRTETRITFLVGAKTAEELLFFPKLCRTISEEKNQVLASTEDGSSGHKGMVTELAEKILEVENIDSIYACGKEAMLYKIFQLAEKHHVRLQASLERLMRCAIGLCGSCALGKYRVCVDGPVFTERQLREAKSEFGRSKRSLDGSSIPI